MLRFTRVKYQNFLAAGNAPIEISLDKYATNLIVGKNGTGKSTMSEAICFAAFGRPLRNINKPKLVNSINGHDCVVELDFIAQNTNYMVRRGIKPNVFEIYENGALIPSPASAADYQAYLETHILKLNYKSFMQVVVLGSSSYVPFMRLPAGARREIIEDLLDIEVFGAMNLLAKDDSIEVKGELEKVVQSSKLIGEQLRMGKQFTEHMKEQREQAIANVEAMIAKTQTELGTLDADAEELSDKLVTFEAVRDAYKKAHEKLVEYQHTLVAIQQKQKKLEKERKFYQDNDTCPTCEQPIDETFKNGRYEVLTTKEHAVVKALGECRQLIDKYNHRTDELQEQLETANTVQREHHQVLVKIPITQKRLQELQSELESHKTPTQQVEVDLSKLEKDLEDLQVQHNELGKKRILIDAASMLLKDSGIKTRVIRHYLPIINKTINHYLNQMDFPVLFTLDEEFTEHIKSRYRDEFAYDSFSEGEKKRIDLALLLTWRAVAALKNSASTNLLILDEVFDSSLDLSGTEEFMKIIAGLEQGTNVFVISHKTDQLVDKFPHVITFEKNRGFSQLK